MSHTITTGTTNVVELTQLYDQFNRAYPDHATVSVTATLYNAAGVAVDGAEGLPVAYEDGTGRRQRYLATLPHSLALTIGDSYQLAIVATVTTDDGDVVRTFRDVLTAVG